MPNIILYFASMKRLINFYDDVIYLLSSSVSDPSFVSRYIWFRKKFTKNSRLVTMKCKELWNIWVKPIYYTLTNAKMEKYMNCRVQWWLAESYSIKLMVIEIYSSTAQTKRIQLISLSNFEGLPLNFLIVLL